MTPPKVVVHLDEREKTPLVLKNVKNLIDELEGVEVEVVAHAGGGVEGGLRTGTSHAALMEELANRGGSGSSSARTLSAPGGASRAAISRVYRDRPVRDRGTGCQAGRRLVLPEAVKKEYYASRTALTTPSWLGLLTIRASPPISVLMMAPFVRSFRRT